MRYPNAVIAPADGEIDEFHGSLEGLVVAEIELSSPDESIILPAWIGEEVSDDPRYYNSSLARAGVVPGR